MLEEKAKKRADRLWNNLFLLTQRDGYLPANWNKLVDQYSEAAEQWCLACAKNNAIAAL